MQTERADSMHKLRAEEGISGHKYSVALLNKTEMGCYLWQHDDLAKKTKKQKQKTQTPYCSSQDTHLFVATEN